MLEEVVNLESVYLVYIQRRHTEASVVSQARAQDRAARAAVVLAVAADRLLPQLGAIGFGGPVALVGNMRRDLVEARKWISDENYDVGLALAQLSPGPLAAQLGFYIGFVHHGVLGATLVGIAFVLPSLVMVVALGWAYALYGGCSGSKRSSTQSVPRSSASSQTVPTG
jgi:hypothetical protein